MPTPIHQHIGPWRSPEPAPGLHAMSGYPLPPTGDTEKAVNMPWSPAARLGLGLQPPRKVATGRGARIRLWHRFRSFVLLAIIVVVGGSVLAGAVGLLLFAAGFLVEQAIG
ncbi:MAG: hypothetical protein VX833_06820 [Actinomycetota bacterium]|nr:hypothetical protein [Actinomycetota bacterium]